MVVPNSYLQLQMPPRDWLSYLHNITFFDYIQCFKMFFVDIVDL